MVDFDYNKCLDRANRFNHKKAKSYLKSIGIEDPDEYTMGYIKKNKDLPIPEKEDEKRTETVSGEHVEEAEAEDVASKEDAAVKIATNMAIGEGAQMLLDEMSIKKYGYEEKCRNSYRWCRFCKSLDRGVEGKDLDCQTMDMKLATDKGTCKVGFKRRF